MRANSIGRWLLLGTFLTVPLVLWSQAGQGRRSLVLHGQPGEAALVQVEGRSYVEVEAIARLANASITYDGNNIVLTFPNCPKSIPVSGFSKEFMRAGIEVMAVIREWRSAVVNTNQRGLPITEDWVAGLRDNAAKNLRLAALAASTDDDRSALQLVTNDFNFMKQLSDQLVAAGKSARYVSPDELANNPLNQKIASCAHSLSVIAANKRFSDDGSCQ